MGDRWNFKSRCAKIGPPRAGGVPLLTAKPLKFLREWRLELCPTVTAMTHCDSNRARSLTRRIPGLGSRWLALVVLASALAAGVLAISSGTARAADQPSAATTGADALLDQLHSGDSGDKFLPVDQAFRLSATAIAAADGSALVRLTWLIAPGYYLYRDRIKVASGSAATQIGKLAVPAGDRRARSLLRQTGDLPRSTGRNAAGHAPRDRHGSGAGADHLSGLRRGGAVLSAHHARLVGRPYDHGR